jgi:hypothetical protein
VGLLVFVVVTAAVVVTPLVWFIVRSRLRPGATKMVLVGAASGEAENELWVAALGSAGIRTHVGNVGDITPYYGSGPSPYSYEIWVPVWDEARAREVLGL